MMDDLRRIKNAKTWAVAHDVPEECSAEDMNLLSDIIKAGVPSLSDYQEGEQDVLTDMQVDVAAYWIWCQSECGEAQLFQALMKRFAVLRGVFLHPSTGRGLFEQHATSMLRARSTH